MTHRCKIHVPVKLVKYKSLAVLCILTIFVKFFVSYSGYTESSVGTSCQCSREMTAGSGNTEKSHLDGIQQVKEGVQQFNGSQHFNQSAFQARFHLEIVSEDPRTKHVWPWGGQEIIKRCKQRDWLTLGALAKTSVIVTFMDKETIGSLLRTIHSIVQRTPKHLLAEIILVEDNCLKEEFHDTLDIYLDAVFGDLVRIMRYSETLGLIKARLAGIRAARGEVVVCMDSHVEVQEKWLEPLLYEIKTNRKTLATSFLDWIEQEDNVWSYRHGTSTWKTYFDMGLVFGFQQISPALEKDRSADPTVGLECPVTVGTIWAMERKFFTDIGEFDEGMELWGGENLDLPLRVWLFGGHVINVPCSHAAHLEKKGYRDYRSKWTGIANKNYKRFMEVWFEDYAQYFYPYFPDIEKIDSGDLSARYAIKQRAKYNATWFFTNVFPQLGIPQIHGLAWGQVINKGTERCLRDTIDSVEIENCGGAPSNFYFYWSKDLLELRFPMHAFNLKQDGIYEIQKDEYMSLFKMNKTTRWLHWKNGPLMVEKEEVCLQTKTKGVQVELATCDFNNPNQQWEFSHYTKDYEDIIAGTSHKYSHLVRPLQKYRKYFNDNSAVL